MMLLCAVCTLRSHHHLLGHRRGHGGWGHAGRRHRHHGRRHSLCDRHSRRWRGACRHVRTACLVRSNGSVALPNSPYRDARGAISPAQKSTGCSHGPLQLPARALGPDPPAGWPWGSPGQPFAPCKQPIGRTQFWVALRSSCGLGGSTPSQGRPQVSSPKKIGRFSLMRLNEM